MNKITKRIKNMAVSQTLAMSQKSRDLQAQGVDVINLSVGEPDFDTPSHIKDAAVQALNDNYTHYTPVPGFMELRKAISDKFKRENNLDFKPEQIVVSNGAKHSILNVIMSIIEDGDEVILLAPYWVSYVEIVKTAGGVPVEIRTEIENDYKATAQQIKNAISDKTQAIMICSPNNPTGTMYSKEELQAIAEMLKDYPNIVVISDEIYEHINFVGKHESIAQFDWLKDRIVVINGVSKGYAMTGWRIGYIGAPKYIANACIKLQGQFTSGACSVSQKAAEAALNAGNESTVEMRDVFKRRRDLVIEHLRKIDGLKVNEPEGAFYIFPDVTNFFGKKWNNYHIENANDLCMYILQEGHVALVPGEAFGEPKCLRISYATSDEQLIEAIRRVKEVLEKLN